MIPENTISVLSHRTKENGRGIIKIKTKTKELKQPFRYYLQNPNLKIAKNVFQEKNLKNLKYFFKP